MSGETSQPKDNHEDTRIAGWYHALNLEPQATLEEVCAAYKERRDPESPDAERDQAFRALVGTLSSSRMRQEQARRQRTDILSLGIDGDVELAGLNVQQKIEIAELYNRHAQEIASVFDHPSTEVAEDPIDGILKRHKTESDMLRIKHIQEIDVLGEEQNRTWQEMTAGHTDEKKSH